MNREIKFRGKRVDNGEWVYGNLIQNKDACFIAEKMQYSHLDYCWDCGKPFDDCYKVIPETIGQYTGLKDKNGTEIFEGDILKKDGCWSIRIEYEDGTYWIKDLDKTRYNNEITCIPISLFDINTWEVIGNIYENPELLKEVSNDN